MALATELQAAGHDVTICTCPQFKKLYVSLPSNFWPLRRFVEASESEFGRSIIESSNSVFGVIRTIPKAPE